MVVAVVVGQEINYLKYRIMKNLLALPSGVVLDTNEIMYLSQISQYGEENGYHYYLTIIFKNNQYPHTLEYRSVDDAEEEYWMIRNTLLGRIVCD